MCFSSIKRTTLDLLMTLICLGAYGGSIAAMYLFAGFILNVLESRGHMHFGHGDKGCIVAVAMIATAVLGYAIIEKYSLEATDGPSE